METCGILFKSPTGKYYVFKTNLKHMFIDELKSYGIDAFKIPSRVIKPEYTVVLRGNNGKQYSYNCEGPVPIEEDGFEIYGAPIDTISMEGVSEISNTHRGKN